MTIEAIMPKGSFPGHHVCELLECAKHTPSLTDYEIVVRHEPHRHDDVYDDFSAINDLVEEGFDNVKNLRVYYPYSQEVEDGFFAFTKKVGSLEAEDHQESVSSVLECLRNKLSERRGKNGPRLNITEGACKET